MEGAPGMPQPTPPKVKCTSCGYVDCRFKDRCAFEREMRQRYEIWTSGIDQNLQLVGGDPYGSLNSLGLLVPQLATPVYPAGQNLRYLFLLAAFAVPDGVIKVVRGIRQYASLIAYPARNRPVELEITSPRWHFVDGDISWHLTTWDAGEVNEYPNLPAGFVNLDTASFALQMAQGPALLYQLPGTTVAAGHAMPNGKPDFYTQLATYTPPRLGRPLGNVVAPELFTWNDLRWGWRSTNAWDWSSRIVVKGAGTPKMVGLWASVRQTNPATRIAIPGTPASAGLPAEENFVLNFPTDNGDAGTLGARYGYVAGSLIVEDVA